jgi:hypothetical protein
VVAGDAPVLVHNSDPTIPPPDPGNVSTARENWVLARFP